MYTQLQYLVPSKDTMSSNYSLFQFVELIPIKFYELWSKLGKCFSKNLLSFYFIDFYLLENNLLNSIKESVRHSMSDIGYHFSDRWTSDRMVDNKPQHFPYEPDTCYCCAGTGEIVNEPPYMQIDLGSEYVISVVQIISRSDINTYRHPSMGSSQPRTGSIVDKYIFVCHI